MEISVLNPKKTSMMQSSTLMQNSYCKCLTCPSSPHSSGSLLCCYSSFLLQGFSWTNLFKWLFIRDLHYELGIGQSTKYLPCKGYLTLLRRVVTSGFHTTEFIYARTYSYRQASPFLWGFFLTVEMRQAILSFWGWDAMFLHYNGCWQHAKTLLIKGKTFDLGSQIPFQLGQPETVCILNCDDLDQNLVKVCYKNPRSPVC